VEKGKKKKDAQKKKGEKEDISLNEREN